MCVCVCTCVAHVCVHMCVRGLGDDFLGEQADVALSQERFMSG